MRGQGRGFLGGLFKGLPSRVSEVTTRTFQKFGNIRVDTIELGHDSDTTLSRVSAGRLAVEGVTLEPGAIRASFHAHKNGSGQNVASTSETQITFGTEAFDVGSHFASNIWTPPAGTVHLIARACILLATAGSVIFRIKKNSTSIADERQDGDGGNWMQLSAIAQCNGTDTFSVYIECPSDSSYTISGDAFDTSFYGTMI